ncbi:glycosyltransferase family 2 protein [Dokdonia sp. PRO95]|uniref:glycosyltransferase family 2 protein n=1 Tax=Dokdonia sp. PRO95 TaxID=1239415 RepID=UPI000559692B|nr:glycosyltransferase family 2 protein [Dokdonia sp. PRO95]
MILSIVTVNMNDVLGLEKTITSVQKQSFEDFEHIIIDGNSDDGSKELINKTQENYSYWISEPDKGIYDAMNKGIKAANGEYILFLNSGDDFFYDDALQDAAVYLNKYDFVYANINVKTRSGQYIKKCPDKLTFSYLYKNVPPHQSTFIRLDLFKKIGLYDTSLSIVADWKFFIIAISKYNATYFYLDKIFTNFYHGGISSISENANLIEIERNEVLESEFSVFVDDMKYRFQLERIIRNLRKSNKIKLLQYLGVLSRF